jgi:TPR repeat protein
VLPNIRKLGENMDKPDLFKNLQAANINDRTVNSYYLGWRRDVKKGDIKSYLYIGEYFEKGLGGEKDIQKALDAYEKYYEGYRKVVPKKFNLIQFLIDIGNNYKSLNNLPVAAEWYLKACMHIYEEYPEEKQQQRLLKKYKLEKLIRETGWSEQKTINHKQ